MFVLVMFSGLARLSPTCSLHTWCRAWFPSSSAWHVLPGPRVCTVGSARALTLHSPVPSSDGDPFIHHPGGAWLRSPNRLRRSFALFLDPPCVRG